MNSTPNLADAKKGETKRYRLVFDTEKPDRTTCARCGCTIGIVKAQGHAFLVDAVGSTRDIDGALIVILGPHDCDRARSRQPHAPGPVLAAEAVGRVLEASRVREIP